jgi:basic amino acid/polyamine antiporter, APA family
MSVETPVPISSSTTTAADSLSASSSPPSLVKQLFRTKTLDAMMDAGKSGHQLKRTLSAFDLTIFGVGAMIGAGIFVLTGTAAADGAGPALTLSFMLTGLVCGFCAMCYSEFAAMAPMSGSAYSYAFSTMGEFIAWIIGWALMLEYAVGNMAVAVGWTGTVKEFLAQPPFNYAMPAFITHNTIEIVPQSAPLLSPDILLTKMALTLPGAAEPYWLLVQKAFNIPAFIIVLLVTTLLVRGVAESARMATIMVFIKSGVILMFIALGIVFLLNGHMDLWHTNWFADGWNTFAPKGYPGILTGAATIFFAYIGFDAVSTAAEETKHPERDIPIGIIGSLTICTILYIIVTSIITGIVPLAEINKEAAVVGAMYKMGVPGAGFIVSLGAIAGLTSVLLVLQMGAIRILYAIARDGLLPKALAKIHPVFSTPYLSTWLMGVFVAIGSGLLPIDLLAHMCNIGTLGAFLVVCVGVAMLRYTDPLRPRPFKMPGGITLPIFGVLGCIFVMSGLPPETWAITLLWFLGGVILYFCYGFKHSNLAINHPDSTP